MGFTVAIRNSMLAVPVAAYVSLHSADPGASGLLNELTGGSPAYARKPAVFNAASAGARALNADVVFDIPAGASVAYVGHWSAIAGTFEGSQIVTTETYAAQGQYTLKATTTQLTAT
jgi:hypothetical protein